MSTGLRTPSDELREDSEEREPRGSSPVCRPLRRFGPLIGDRVPPTAPVSAVGCCTAVQGFRGVPGGPVHADRSLTRGGGLGGVLLGGHDCVRGVIDGLWASFRGLRCLTQTVQVEMKFGERNTELTEKRGCKMGVVVPGSPPAALHKLPGAQAHGPGRRGESPRPAAFADLTPPRFTFLICQTKNVSGSITFLC